MEPIAVGKLHIPGESLLLRDLFVDGVWHLAEVVGSLTLQEVQIMSHNLFLTTGNDKHEWKPSSNGDFTWTSVYDLIRNKRASQI